MELPLFDHIRLTPGDTLTQGYVYETERAEVGEDGETADPVDLTGWEAAWTFTPEFDGGEAFALTTLTGELAATGEDGVIAPSGTGWPVPADLAAGVYRMALVLTDPDGRVSTLVDGKCEV